MRKPSQSAIKKAGMFLYMAHLLLCYASAELNTAGYTDKETVSVRNDLNRLDVHRNVLDELFNAYCKDHGADYDYTVFRPGDSIDNVSIHYIQDGEEKKLPLKVRRKND